MKKKVEELLKKSMQVTESTKKEFEDLVYDEYIKETISSYDRFYLIQAADYFSRGMQHLVSKRISWTQGYLRKEDDGKNELYAGRLGYGYIEHIRDTKSSRYHLIAYHINVY